MTRSLWLLASLTLAVTACTQDGTDFPELGSLTVPGNEPVTEIQPIGRLSEVDRSYATEWTCLWDAVPTSWNLPGVQINDGRAHAINEWTRLTGTLNRTRGDGEKLSLAGERLSNDGYWYPMEMAGTIYPDRSSTLFGFWKGATCEAELTPIAAAETTAHRSGSAADEG